MNLVGKTLGNYQIVAEIGRGGMGVVYRGFQVSLNRHVAIKVLPPQFTFDEQFVQRFQREARAAAQLSHPNIVTVHDVGEQDGIYYIVMEEVQGESLSSLIRRTGRLPLARAAGQLTGDFASDPAWSPDSQWVVFTRGVDTNQNGVLDSRDESDLWAVQVGTGLLMPALQAPGSDFAPSWTASR